ncbi:hypothetical protein C1I98_10445 [Spongiactinospora gelatinilytica]|uniref:Secreted protein n=1 Tax=Spongiactinospora gelatinilytica TaxID=2666298 RepID=A0A2W2IK37_9ACTN|nr:hypothetical protein [Spongiactinospora gelatinilytica]PZG50454.1 hypothetical protein C1I98_10445 [Spongiactinospora gelatinilytica]
MKITRSVPALAVGAAAMAGTLLTAPPAYAADLHDCWFGGLTSETEEGYYELWGGSCSGFGYANVDVKIRSGTDAGLYHCGHVFPWNGTLEGWRCVVIQP